MASEKTTIARKETKPDALQSPEHQDARGGTFQSPPTFQLKAKDPAKDTARPDAAEAAAGAVVDAGFGIKVDHDAKTMTIVANVYTSTAGSNSQALAAAATWNAKSAVVDGYTISFDIAVIPAKPVSEAEVVAKFSYVEFYDEKGNLKEGVFAKYRNAFLRMSAVDAAVADPIGKSFCGNQGMYSHVVHGAKFDGGQTGNGKHADMNTHLEKGDQGKNNDLVVHEFGHYFGLDDEDGNHDGKTDPYYPGDGGTMEYEGSDLHDISDADVTMILQYAKETLAKANEGGESAIKILETVGSSEGANPLGIKATKKDE